MTLWRVLPWDPSAADGSPGHPRWVPRALQGTARHDAPQRYGCLYLAQDAVSAVAETLAPFRGVGELDEGLLTRAGRPLALAALELSESGSLLDLDDPAVLVDEAMRPSTVASGRRALTRAYAEALFDRHPQAAGLRWWSTLESTWINVTLFDRAVDGLVVTDVEPLTVDDDVVVAAAAHVGLA